MRHRFTARPTSYRGTLMRSRLEATFAAWLDDRGITWEYEHLNYDDGRRSYMPDFRLPALQVAADKALVFVEVKPAVPGLELDAVLDGMEPIWTDHPDALLVIASPHDDSFHRFPYRYRHRGKATTRRHGYWLSCEHCTATGIADLAEAEYDFYVGDSKPRTCLACGRVGAFTVNPWLSEQYYRYMEKWPAGGGR